ncbi:MAG: hypothetical protein ACFB50_13330 [Rubrobacteraceae bacterium]
MRGRKLPLAAKTLATVGVWSVVWGGVYAVCMGMFGHAAALAGNTALVLGVALLWYRTRRGERETG